MNERIIFLSLTKGFSISICSLILVFALLLTNEFKVGVANKTFSVSDYEVVGNGLTDDSSAFTKAWKDACSSTAGASTISVPQGKKYHLNPINFVGPCKSYINLAAFTKAWNDACNAEEGTSTIDVPQGKTYLLNIMEFAGPCKLNINFTVLGEIIAPKDPSAWKEKDQWLIFDSINGLTISGPGSFDGNGKPWWGLSCKLNPTTGCNTYAPTTLRIEKCNGVYLQDLHFKNSPQMHLIVYGSSDVYMKSLNISAPEESPNTDGIHIGSSHGVSVRSSIIGTGDDCISISDQTSNISVSDIRCGPGHGISIGSLGKDGEEASVSNIDVKNVDFYGSTNGARIKTWQEGRDRVSQVFFSNLRFTAVKNPIIIDQYYCDARDACPKTETGVQISDVHYQMASGTSSTKVAINLNCSNNVPCTNINLDTIKLESANEGEEPISSCNNAFGTTVGIVEPKSCLQ
ncbi:polygalacturonase ADPG1-like [Syzygium oleosum]|uniref:polygalacturonase ADPG1-like n=1 Tax=Syzygium oleosum TaxID=219896 RepID=UPI0024B9A80E|nr:polygalacturonase ADPG1-like [Syzygium oleosum]